MRRNMIKRSALRAGGKEPTQEDLEFLAADTKTDASFVKSVLAEAGLMK